MFRSQDTLTCCQAILESYAQQVTILGHPSDKRTWTCGSFNDSQYSYNYDDWVNTPKDIGAENSTSHTDTLQVVRLRTCKLISFPFHLLATQLIIHIPPSVIECQESGKMAGNRKHKTQLEPNPRHFQDPL
jgi:hypothetical protein